MTYHSSLAWTFEHEVTDEVVQEVLRGLQANKEYNKGKCYTPTAYSTFNATDSLIFQIGKFLDAQEGQGPIRREAVETFLQKAPESGKVITKRVLKSIK